MLLCSTLLKFDLLLEKHEDEHELQSYFHYKSDGSWIHYRIILQNTTLWLPLILNIRWIILEMEFYISTMILLNLFLLEKALKNIFHS